MRKTKRLKRLSRPKTPQSISIKADYLPSEAQIAIAFVSYVDKKHPSLSEDLIKVDNENKCSPQEGRRKKLMGKRKGASDYFFSRPKKRFRKDTMGEWWEVVYFGLWLEIKSAKGKESPEQKRFGERALANGYQYRVVYSLDEAISVFEEYVA